MAQWDPAAIAVDPRHEDVARNPALLPEFIEAGRQLFLTKFNDRDGAGRPGATGDSKPTVRDAANNMEFVRSSGPDAMACVSCHNDPVAGGSGDFVANVFVGAHFADPPTFRIGPETTNERNTIGIFGAGLIETVAVEMTDELQRLRDRANERAMATGLDQEIKVSAKGVDFGKIIAKPNGTLDIAGLRGIDEDLVVRPFGTKGIAASLREFTIAALNQHHGIQPIERFGWEKTGRRDFDQDGHANEFSLGQVSALVIFQASLPAPRRQRSIDPDVRRKEQEGERTFREIGCATCHIPELPLSGHEFVEPNKYNRPGTLRPADIEAPIVMPLPGKHRDGASVRAYTDLKRHNLCDADINHFCNERHRQDQVDVDLFLTAKLWDLATSAPYGHRGDLRTLSKAILAHGGEARNVRENFLNVSESKKKNLILFLLSLGRGRN